ncbi:MAG TPA: FAD-dependent oxidoreductase [Syntrophorhabdaceae bacterium]|nr:FAD-dependent oxidoreductase [Syntrophorhabdaceae bacterium]
MRSTGKQQVPPPADRGHEADIVIAGGGLSGLSAALTAAENGVKAIVLEKMPFPGGAGLFPEGSLGIGTRYQKENGIRTTTDQVFARVMEFHHWRCNAPVIRTLLDESGATIDWLEDHGIRIKGIRTMFPPEKSLQVWHIFEGGGVRVVKVMSGSIKEKGGPILTGTPVEELLINDGGVVTGVMARGAGGETITIAAKAVIIATGGFAGNAEMLRKYVPDVNAPGMAKLMHRGPAVDGRTGDGINMALRAGAALSGMGTLAGNSPYLDNEPAIRQFSGPDHMKQMRCALSQPFLWVNRQGDRFYNESFGSVFSDVYNAMTSNGGLMWSIFDDSMRRYMIENGPLTPFNAIVVPGQKMTALDKGIQKGIGSGFAFKADTIEELAGKIGIGPDKLRDTIEKVNHYADQKKDPDFNRKPEHLIKFDTENGPYYALKGLRAFFLTLGGAQVNTRMQALNGDGEVIPGLYVTGQDMGGLYDSTYDLLAEGSASSFALSSGRIAVRSIMEIGLAGKGGEFAR